MTRLLAIVVALALLWPGQSHASGISPSAIIAEIAHDGAATVVRKLDAGSGASWNAVVRSIASGRRDWLGVARALYPGVDAGTGEDLTDALAAALRKNPTGVLMMTGSDFPIAKICAVPLIEPTDAQVKHWKRGVLTALESVRAPSLTARVDACRAAIESVPDH